MESGSDKPEEILMVEVYLMKIKLCLYPKDKLFQEFSFSRGDTVGRKVHNKM